MRFLKQRDSKYHSSDENFSWENEIARIPLTFVGLWPNGGQQKIIKFVLTFTYIVMVSMIPALVKFWFIDDDDKFFTYFISGTMQPYIVSSMLIVMHNENAFESIIREMLENWRNSLNDETTEIMHSYAKKSRFASMAVFGSTTSSFILFIGEPLMNTLKSNWTKFETPGDFWYPFTISNPGTYAITYCTGIFGVALGGLVLCGLDSCLFLSVFHACGQMDLLRHKISNFQIGKRHNSSAQSESSSNSCTCLKCIVDDQVKIRRFVNKIDDCFNIVLLLRLAITTVHVTVETFEMLKAVEYRNYSQVPPNVAYLFMMSSALLIYCWFGEQCIKYSNSINDALCGTMWEGEITKSSKSLVLMFRYSQKPFTITAGRFFILSLTLYKEFIFTTTSYISVLLAMILDQ